MTIAVVDREPVFIISPLAPITYSDGLITTQADHEALAEALCFFAAQAGFAPYAPHLLFTRFLEDKIPTERQIGIDCGRAMLPIFKKAFVYTRQHPEKLSVGMKGDVDRALALGCAVIFDPPCFEKVNPIPAHPKRLAGPGEEFPLR